MVSLGHAIYFEMLHNLTREYPDNDHIVVSNFDLPFKINKVLGEVFDMAQIAFLAPEQRSQLVQAVAKILTSMQKEDNLDDPLSRVQILRIRYLYEYPGEIRAHLLKDGAQDPKLRALMRNKTAECGLRSSL